MECFQVKYIMLLFSANLFVLLRNFSRINHANDGHSVFILKMTASIFPPHNVFWKETDNLLGRLRPTGPIRPGCCACRLNLKGEWWRPGRALHHSHGKDNLQGKTIPRGARMPSFSRCQKKSANSIYFVFIILCEIRNILSTVAGLPAENPTSLSLSPKSVPSLVTRRPLVKNMQKQRLQLNNNDAHTRWQPWPTTKAPTKHCHPANTWAAIRALPKSWAF